MKPSPLHRKAIRDAWRLRGQLLAISAVVASGVATFITMRSTLSSLESAMSDLYADQRFADVFCSVVRAPESVAERLQAIPGVSHVETRVVAAVTLGVQGSSLPITGKIVAVPDSGEPRLNAPYVTLGRLPTAGRTDEVAVYAPFANAWGIRPGDAVTAIVQERQLEFRVVGLAMSPEYVLARAEGSVAPDDLAFGILWAGRSAVAAAFDMQGAFNDVSLRLSAAAQEQEVIRLVDLVLDPFGGLGAFGREDQESHWFLANELDQLSTLAALLPAIFFSVATVLFAIVMGRIIAASRAEIAVLKAFGYSNSSIALHYGTLVLISSCAATLAGLAAGKWMGSGMLNLYRDSFRFPRLEHELSFELAAFAGAIAVLSGVVGAVHALRAAMALPPAEAMRDPAPPSFGTSLFERRWLMARLPITARIMLRNIARQPLRSTLNVLGAASGGALLLSGLAMQDSVSALVNEQFEVNQHEDITVRFAHPRARSVLNSLQRLPGVRHVEGMRLVPARISAETRSQRVALEGIERDSILRPPATGVHRALSPATPVVSISKTLARTLAVRVGDMVHVELLDGTRRRQSMGVASIDPTALGPGARMDLTVLSGLLGDGPSFNAAHLVVDEDRLEDLNEALAEAPLISSYHARRDELRRFDEQSAASMTFMAIFLVLFATILVAGVVYNNARIALAERGRELASMRVLGYRRTEIAGVLLGELSLLSVLSIPVGFGLGWLLAWGTLVGLESDMFTIALVIDPASHARTGLVVLLATALASVLIEKRLQRLDMIEVLKTRA